jgi:hypothetical protein
MDTTNPIDFPVLYSRVAYDSTDQESFFETLVDRWLEQLSSRVVEDLAPVRDQHARDMYIASWLSNLASCAAPFFPRMKRHDFHAENEWRLVHGHLEYSPDCPVVRSGGGKTHVELDLRHTGERIPLTSVWLGPGIANRESKQAMRDFLDRHGYSATSVRLSPTRLRIENRILDF